VAHLHRRSRAPAADAAALGPRRTLIGQPLQPVLPATAAAQAHGLINGEHVEVIRQAGHAHHYLAGFHRATGSERNLI
jgi:Domain of unknown function (DUF222)